jgi:hypothetical protein
MRAQTIRTHQTQPPSAVRVGASGPRPLQTTHTATVVRMHNAAGIPTRRVPGCRRARVAEPSPMIELTGTPWRGRRQVVRALMGSCRSLCCACLPEPVDQRRQRVTEVIVPWRVECRRGRIIATTVHDPTQSHHMHDRQHATPDMLAREGRWLVQRPSRRLPRHHPPGTGRADPRERTNPRSWAWTLRWRDHSRCRQRE